MQSRLWLPAILLLAFAMSTHAAAPATNKVDVRIVIDVSGSMKGNDPHNLRQPALRLLAHLLPAGSRAGVWTFAESANLLTPLGPVDDAWRSAALAASHHIHSRGRFTDINKALESTTTGWQSSQTEDDRMLILLTDGMNDISKDAEHNASSRALILSNILPKLQAAGVAVHTLALSANADADLMQELALGTAGSFNQADDADQLERLFLHIFERAIPHDALPLIENRFQVDRHVTELTLLVFREPGSIPTHLLAPSGIEYSQASAPASIRWHNEANYDLVTIAKPETGFWRLLANTDPDNRALVLTDLSLQVDPVPDVIFAGEQTAFHAKLKEAGQVISEADFLELVHVEVTLEHLGTDSQSQQILEPSPAHGGFSAEMNLQLSPGAWQFVTQARSPTFSREKRQRVIVHGHPFAIALKTNEETPSSAQIELSLVDERLKSNMLQLIRFLPTDHECAKLPELRESAEGWLLDVDDLDPSRDYTFALQLSGQLPSGREFRLNLPKIEHAASITAPIGHSANWPVIIIVLVTGNMALIMLAALGFHLRLNRRRMVQAQDLAESDTTDSMIDRGTA